MRDAPLRLAGDVALRTVVIGRDRQELLSGARVTESRLRRYGFQGYELRPRPSGAGEKRNGEDRFHGLATITGVSLLPTIATGLPPVSRRTTIRTIWSRSMTAASDGAVTSVALRAVCGG